MAKTRELLGFVAQAAIAGLALAFLVVYFFPAATERMTSREDDRSNETTPYSYADAVNRAAPAVVSIYTRRITTQPAEMDSWSRLGARFLYKLTRGQGSGVILSEDGTILTNHHVINRAQNIRVALWDGRIAEARVVGIDPATDLAVLKVDLDGLPVAPLSETPEVRVGDVVLAIGNALGLSHTVTMGIVSATGRNDLNSLLYEDFIQTDAAINAGNSGGALVNATGELVGINARNLDPGEGAQNIGFAIPIGLARNVMEQIVEYGSVRRSWLGASFSDIRPTPLADGSLIRQGISVRQVVASGPAWNAGIRPGDVIMAMDGELVSDASQFLFAISQRPPGSQVEFEVNRQAETFQTYATLIQQPPLKP
jgi:serine peptidase DegS